MGSLPALTVWYVISALWAFINAAAFSVTGIYYVNEVGLDPLELILIGTAMETAAFLFEIPTGVIADVYSRRLSVILGIFLTGLSIVMIGMYPDFHSIVFGAFLFGLASTFISGALDAWLADEIGEENLAPAYFRAAQLGYAGAFVGILVGVGLATLWLSLAIVVAGLCAIALSLFLAVSMPEVGFRRVEGEERASWNTLRSTFLDATRQVRTKPILLGLLSVSAVMGMYSEGIDRLSEPHLLTNFEFPVLGSVVPVVWLGGIRMVSLGLGIVGTALAKRLVDPARSREASTTLFAITAIEIVGTLVFALSGHFALAVASIWLAGMARSSAGPIYRTWLNQDLDSRSRATVISMSSQMNALGQIAGGPAVGSIGNLVSLRAALVCSGLVLSPALWLYHRMRKGRVAGE